MKSYELTYRQFYVYCCKWLTYSVDQYQAVSDLVMILCWQLVLINLFMSGILKQVVSSKHWNSSSCIWQPKSWFGLLILANIHSFKVNNHHSCLITSLEWVTWLSDYFLIQLQNWTLKLSRCHKTASMICQLHDKQQSDLQLVTWHGENGAIKRTSRP